MQFRELPQGIFCRKLSSLEPTRGGMGPPFALTTGALRTIPVPGAARVTDRRRPVIPPRALAQLGVELVEEVGGGAGDVGAGAERGLGAVK